jgi:DNA-binding TFAR19-related protein (PDSD5 family)
MKLQVRLRSGIFDQHRQLIEARTDLDRIGLVRPDLADSLEAVRAQLDASHHF